MPKNPTVAHVWMACCRFRVVTRASSSAPCAPPRRSPRSAVAAAPSRRPHPPRAPIRAVRADADPLATSWTPLPSSGGGAIGPAVASPRPPRTSPTSTASRVPSRPRPRRLPPTADLAGTSRRLLGCAQATLPAPASWLASPFFWIAKEAQHESHRLAVRVPDLFPPFKLAARISAGDPPKTGEEWIRAFGRREVSAAFPSRRPRIRPQSSRGSLGGRRGARRLRASGGTEPPPNVSRVHVDFADGGLVGELVTACTLEPEETGDASPSSTGDASPSSTGDASPSTGDAFPSRRRACLETTTFEGTGTPLDGVSVPSGAIMRVLMSPSPRLRRMRGRGGAAPATTYRPAISDDGDAMVVLAGSCDETARVLVYARERESRRA